jgi:hypothetical protein
MIDAAHSGWRGVPAVRARPPDRLPASRARRDSRRRRPSRTERDPRCPKAALLRPARRGVESAAASWEQPRGRGCVTWRLVLGCSSAVITAAGRYQTSTLLGRCRDFCRRSGPALSQLGIRTGALPQIASTQRFSDPYRIGQPIRLAPGAIPRRYRCPMGRSSWTSARSSFTSARSSLISNLSCSSPWLM